MGCKLLINWEVVECIEQGEFFGMEVKSFSRTA